MPSRHPQIANLILFLVVVVAQQHATTINERKDYLVLALPSREAGGGFLI